MPQYDQLYCYPPPRQQQSELSYQASELYYMEEWEDHSKYSWNYRHDPSPPPSQDIYSELEAMVARMEAQTKEYTRSSQAMIKILSLLREDGEARMRERELQVSQTLATFKARQEEALPSTVEEKCPISTIVDEEEEERIVQSEDDESEVDPSPTNLSPTSPPTILSIPQEACAHNVSVTLCNQHWRSRSMVFSHLLPQASSFAKEFSLGR